MLSSTISSISLPLRTPAASRRLTTARADPKGNLPPKEYPPSPVTSIKKWSSDQSVKDRPKPNSETVNPLEMSRTYRRTVFDLDDWKRHRESSRYFRHMVSLPEVRAWVLPFPGGKRSVTRGGASRASRIPRRPLTSFFKL